ncbi:hypothetical protein A5780_30805 [Nocardia sp. 852002-20019_SCH5090214]|uniref:ESAT-6-like protein n=1 Tax=Nocardia nova TaxID=37330 RepID=A0A2S6A6W4_9NOCA|nr:MULTISPECIES: WXG100 family type VII secretion target [Nocardia]OBA50816.1 hypothetical protein A5780_30805 [Nocardia sp. 852002-20019_SCH5090214]PPJ28509.1 WXG100 family type VII secretion target [Nocardia nova]
MPFHAEGDQLNAFAQEMEKKHQDIAGMIQAAHGNATDLQGPAFQGGAGKAFQATFEQFLTAANKMNDALLQNSENLKSAGSKYAEMEEQNLSHLQQSANSPSLNWT